MIDSNRWFYGTTEAIKMKFGMRTPSIKKSIKARTTGKAKRAVKKALIPGYGKNVQDGLRIQRKQLTIRFIRRRALAL